MNFRSLTISMSAPSASQRGMAAAWMTLLLAAMIGLLAIVIDVGRVRIAQWQMQNAADATALAATARLRRSSPLGWQLAKRSAIFTLREHILFGAPANFSANLNFFSSEPDELEENPDYRGTTASVGNMTVTIERGVYWRNADGFREFRSLEHMDPETVDDPTEAAEAQGRQKEVPMFFHMPVYLISNAVRVRIENAELNTIFGKILGLISYRNLERTALAVTSDDYEQPVAPFAIPACSLMLDLWPGLERPWVYNTDYYSPEHQCQRELVFTEADPFTQNPSLDDGRLRFYFYPRPWRYLWSGIERDLCHDEVSSGPQGAINCKNIPLAAVMGIPHVLNPNLGPEEPASENDLVTAITQPDGQVTASLGMQFHPFEGLPPGSIPAIPPRLEGEFSMELGRLIRTAPAEHDLNWRERPFQFPARFFSQFGTRTSGTPDSDLVWSRGPLMYEMGSADNEDDFETPLCHDAASIQRQWKFQAREMTAMVIAPENPDSRYCDFPAVFGQKAQDTVPPTASTRPVIVGFVKVLVFDFNFKQLGDGGDNVFLPGDNSPNRLVVRESEFTSKMRPYITYPIDHLMPGEVPTPPPPPPASGFDIPPRPDWELSRICYDLPEWDDLMTCIGWFTSSNPLDWLKMLVSPDPDTCAVMACKSLTHPACIPLELLGLQPYGNRTAPEVVGNRRCVPRPRPNQSNYATMGAWETPRPRKAQRGCAGVRARVDCLTPQTAWRGSLTSPRGYLERKPVLIKEGG